ncbi:hypothetical protein [Clavibacter michiganensis]|uniref:hypothetical protein n=1 Tax=Clavibacter michiganensis TaxID=28447 RepID=UPI0010542AFD|nr:hypothetical protein [Clavibacter michiganensis]
MSLARATAAVSNQGELSPNTLLLILLPSTIALIGVLISTIVSTVATSRAEDRRSRNATYAQVLEAGREAELDALYATATFIAKLKQFNISMYGNTGVGADDDRSAAAFHDFTQAFDGFDELTRAALNVEALGDTEISDRIKAIRSRTQAYVMSIGGPIFKATSAVAFELEVDNLMQELIEAVRADFRTAEARYKYQGRRSR